MNRLKCLSGSTLKIIAMITMIIDHTGATVIERLLYGLQKGDIILNECSPFTIYLYETIDLYQLDRIMRSIGRIAFPIYCFLLVQGFMYTSNRKRYALRLGVFALISQFPFYLSFSMFYEGLFSYTNVFFTLFFGLLMMMGLDALDHLEAAPVIRIIWKVIAVIVCMGIVTVMNTDYAVRGILCILVLYLFRYNKGGQLLAGAASFYWELPAPLAFIPIAMYNGKKGLKLKYVFYLFYPVHLFLLYLVSVAMGLT